MKKRLITIFFLLSTTSCSKGWLEAKRDLNTVLPTTLEDLYAILHVDSTPSIANDMAAAALVSCDDYYIGYSQLVAWGELEFNLYTWAQKSFPPGTNVTEWNGSYEQVFYANIVLEKLAGIPRTTANANLWDQVRGGALFFRAKAFFNLARLFAPPYRAETAATDQGIPLRIVSDPNTGYSRASLDDTYTLILKDLREAARRLNNSADIATSASKPAAFGLLARICLSMGSYVDAGRYADSCLQLHDALLDYNEVQAVSDSNYPFPLFNPEVIFHSFLMISYGSVSVSSGKVDSLLFQEYDEHDLRKNLFFRSTSGFRGNYTASNQKFGGIATDEILLIRAECAAREGNAESALTDLNGLLEKRYTQGSYVPYAGLSGETLLNLILRERRKELVFRGERWNDLRRLNQETGREITLVRFLEDTRYELPPNDPRYTLPIPDEVIRASGMPQNER